MRFFLWRVFLLTLLTFPSITHAYRVPDRDYWRAYTITLINQSRAEHGLPLIGLDEEITDMSQVHAQDTSVSFDDASDASRRSSYLAHDSSDGRTFADRIRGRIFSGLKAAGENTGFRYRGPVDELQQMVRESIDLLHNGMMAEVPPDDGHRQTILGDYTHAGVGLEFHRDPASLVNTLFFVMDFGKFGPERAQNIPELGAEPKPIYTAPLRGEQKPTTPESVEPRRVRRRTSPPFPTWAERHRMRQSSRRNERLARRLQRVEERRQARLRRRGF